MTSSWPGSGEAETGTRSTASFQPGIASAAVRPTTSAAAMNVIASAAGFQSRTTPCTVEQQDAVGDVLEHPGRVGALLDLAVEPRAVEREGEPCGEILGKRDVLGRVHRPALGPCEREHAEPLLARAKGDETTERASRLPKRYGFGLERSSSGGRMLVRPRSRTARTSASGSSAGTRPPSGWSSLRARLPRGGGRSRRRRRRPGTSRRSRPRSAPRSASARGRASTPAVISFPTWRSRSSRDWRSALSEAAVSLGGLEQLAPVVAALQLAHVAQEGLDIERLAFRVAHRGGVLAHPDGTAVAREQAVLERADGAPVLARSSSGTTRSRSSGCRRRR